MWTLTPPDLANVRQDLDTVFPVGTVPPTEQDKDDLETLYWTYAQFLGRPNAALLGVNLTADFKARLEAAYAQVQQNGQLASLRDALKLLAEECPYCGFGQVQDIDHHLPKAAFKAFSIFPLNLVPCCATCNRGKPRKPRDDSRQHLLHPYLEHLSHHNFLVAQVRVDPDDSSMRVEFVIGINNDVDDELRARLENHLKIYNLHERYPAQVNIYLSALSVAFDQAFSAGGADALREFLILSADRNAVRFGANDWRTAVLRGLAECDGFCDGGFQNVLG